MPLLTGTSGLPALLRQNSLTAQMVRIRLLEDRLQALCDIGEGADLHFNRGQEAISVGVISALRDTDYVVCHHRTIAHAVARGVPLRPLIAELLGKADGMNGGMAGEMHMSYPAVRFMFTFQLVGTCVPVAAGLAWAAKEYLKTDAIVAVFHGDAATANGQWHEGLNLAAVQGLPLLLICENNRLAGNVRPVDYLPTLTVAERAAGYGIRCDLVDGNDVAAVQDAAAKAIRYVREKSRPFLLDCQTNRLGRHKQGMGDMRSKEEMTVLMAQDPLRGVDMRLYASISDELNSVVQSVRESPDPVFQEGGV